MHSVNYSRALRVNVELENKETGELYGSGTLKIVPFLSPVIKFSFADIKQVIISLKIRVELGQFDQVLFLLGKSYPLLAENKYNSNWLF